MTRKLWMLLGLAAVLILAGCTTPEEADGGDGTGGDMNDTGDTGTDGTGTDGTGTDGTGTDGTGNETDRQHVMIDGFLYACVEDENATGMDGTTGTDAGAAASECPRYELDEENMTGDGMDVGEENNFTSADGQVLIDGTMYECESQQDAGDGTTGGDTGTTGTGGTTGGTGEEPCQAYVLAEEETAATDGTTSG